MDKDYWKKYYEDKPVRPNPTPFAKWLTAEFSIEGQLLELGCGNGRDSLYFADLGIPTTGIDQCENVVKELNNLPGKARFISDDFTNIQGDIFPENVYSRFSLHSVTEEQCNRTLRWVARNMGKGIFAVEVRSTKDALCGQGRKVEKNTWYTDHARRFIDFEEFKDKLTGLNLKIDFEVESTGLAVYGNEDPVTIRVVCHR